MMASLREYAEYAGDANRQPARCLEIHNRSALKEEISPRVFGKTVLSCNFSSEDTSVILISKFQPEFSKAVEYNILPREM